jgi:hypothetical protein
MLLFRHAGKTSSIPPPAGGLTAAIVVVARQRKEYHVVAAVEGHELKTPETEHCPGLERLLETTHLELDGKLFVNTQQALPGAPTVGVSTPEGPWTDEYIVAACPSLDGSVRDGTQGGKNSKGKPRPSCCPAPKADALAVGGYKRSRGREREREGASLVRRPVLPRGHLLVREPWTFLL